MELNEIMKLDGNKRSKKRVGRGIGSGKGGHYSGRGQKGQKAREGHKFSVGYEGGQTPLYKSLPQIGGFRNFNAIVFTTLSLDKLNKFEDTTEVTPEALIKAHIVKNISKHGVKILAVGKLTKKLTLTGFIFSEKAKELVEKSGSTING